MLHTDDRETFLKSTRAVNRGVPIWHFPSTLDHAHNLLRDICNNLCIWVKFDLVINEPFGRVSVQKGDCFLHDADCREEGRLIGCRRDGMRWDRSSFSMPISRRFHRGKSSFWCLSLYWFFNHKRICLFVKFINVVILISDISDSFYSYENSSSFGPIASNSLPSTVSFLKTYLDECINIGNSEQLQSSERRRGVCSLE